MHVRFVFNLLCFTLIIKIYENVFWHFLPLFLQHGIVKDWNDMERIWQYIYSKDQLQTFSEEVIRFHRIGFSFKMLIYFN